ncbi:glycosyltransferase family 4 protein [Leptolyngbya sp. FACHB-261]|uniref:glycosyltransferase family 4 protein n=1 Tax=Leptolyngbya sp. FACHB-261 TaxID=2692806 RepID=UPI0016840795|nr:glycosyltransferase [Leptolyngbya sp. FACHB-261]MBD2103236.1 glycosyltransferase [Leptolyngbya sp. FACHB-261]
MPLARPRVLLIAELANPEWGSVPLVGWSHSQAIAALTDAYIVTHSRNRKGFVRAGCVEGKDFTAIDVKRISKPINQASSWLRGGAGRGWTTVMALSVLSYYYFEHLVWQQFGDRISAGQFDLVHRVTPVSPTVPSLLARKCAQAGVPFVLGPLNGGLPWPRGFDALRRKEKEWLSYIRWMYRLLPGYTVTRRHAAAIMVGSQATWEQMPARYRDKCIYMPENAIDPQRFSRQRSRQVTQPLRAIFVGRLVPYKGADMLIEAVAPLVRAGRLTLKILGHGPELPVLKALIEREGVSEGIELTGRVEHTRVQGYLAEADVFAFPSIREFGGAVVLEAMSIGLVPIVINYGGPGELVTPSTGYALPLGSRTELVTRLRDLLNRLASDPSGLAQMSQNARNRALEQFTWQAKAKQTLAVYQWVLGQRTDKPDFGMPFPELIPQSSIGH